MIDIINTRTVTYPKFMKFKESIRRGFIPNYITGITKKLVLEDNKRSWHEEFSPDNKQTSEPIRIEVWDLRGGELLNLFIKDMCFYHSFIKGIW